MTHLPPKTDKALISLRFQGFFVFEIHSLDKSLLFKSMQVEAVKIYLSKLLVLTQ